MLSAAIFPQPGVNSDFVPPEWGQVRACFNPRFHGPNYNYHLRLINKFMKKRAMITPGSGKPLLEALAGVAQTKPPVWLMRQAGRYLPEYRALRARTGGFLELCLTPELAAEVTLQPIRRYAMDGAILFSDILMVPHGLGQPVSFRDGEGPVLEALEQARDVSRLSMTGFAARVAPIAETVRRGCPRLPGGGPLFPFPRSRRSRRALTD